MTARISYAQLPTERRNPASHRLDTLSSLEILRLMSQEDIRAVNAVRKQHRPIAEAITHISQALRSGGRLFFVGAGTSGRLGVLEAAECPPTFHTAPSLVQAMLAGGRSAVFRSREGAEDDRASAKALALRSLRSGDIVIGIAASGVTPFVDEVLRIASSKRLATGVITCNPKTSLLADWRIVVSVGPEILTGSTRLKAATATKLVLNMLTLGVMVELGKTFGNLMVDVRPTSAKLKARAVRIIQTLTGCSPQAATRALGVSEGNVKTAVLMLRKKISAAIARKLLEQSRGSLRQALEGGKRATKRSRRDASRV